MRRSELILVVLLPALPAGLPAQRAPITGVARPSFTPLAAPAGLTVSGQAPQITLTWQATLGALDYTVLRTPDPNLAPVAVATGVTTTSYVDQSAARGTAYYYSVAARNAMNQTATSAAVRFDPPPPPVKSGRPTKAGLTMPAGFVPAVTSVSDTIVDPGGPTETVIKGVGMWDVSGIYFDGSYASGVSTIQASPQPMKIVPTYVSPNGDEVRFRAPVQCRASGSLLLEQYGNPYGQSSYIETIPAYGQPPSPFRLRCLGKPTLTGVQGTVRPGAQMQVVGTNLVGVTAVTDLAHNGAAMTFSVPNPNIITVSVPNYTAQQNPNGFVVIQPSAMVRGISLSLPPMQIFLPPLVTSVTGPVVSPLGVPVPEPGGLAVISGFGFGSNPTVSINGQQMPLQPGSNTTTINVQVPPGVTGMGAYTVTNTSGLSVSGGFPLATGPAVITSVSPASAPVGGRITITGDNLFLARGVCFTPGPSGVAANLREALGLFSVGSQAPAWQQWSNTSVTVDVPPFAGTGRIGIWTAPTQRGQYCQWTGVGITVQ